MKNQIENMVNSGNIYLFIYSLSEWFSTLLKINKILIISCCKYSLYNQYIYEFLLNYDEIQFTNNIFYRFNVKTHWNSWIEIYEKWTLLWRRARVDGVQDTLVCVRHKTMSQRSFVLFAENNGHLFLKKLGKYLNMLVVWLWIIIISMEYLVLHPFLILRNKNDIRKDIRFV